MRLVWTKSSYLGNNGDLITWGLDEPVSHFAIILFESIVFHSSWFGVEIDSLDDFKAHRIIVLEKPLQISQAVELGVLNKMSKMSLKGYDWKFFFWLVWRAFLKKIFNIPIPNKPQEDKSSIICQEALEALPMRIRPVYDKNKAVTPFALYKELSS